MLSPSSHDHDLKSKTKEPLKVLPCYNFPAQWHPLFGNQSILNFEVIAVRDVTLRSRLSKNIHLSRDF